MNPSVLPNPDEKFKPVLFIVPPNGAVDNPNPPVNAFDWVVALPDGHVADKEIVLSWDYFCDNWYSLNELKKGVIRYNILL